MKAALAALACAAAAAARADEPRIVALPGPSQKISHALSASRDTASLGYQLTPYSVLTGAGDVGLVGLERGELSARLGFFGMVELESSTPYDPKKNGFTGVLPGAGVHYWRGVAGFQMAVAFDEWGRRLLGSGGLLEATVGYRHESEHFTGSNSGGPPDDVSHIPQIGDFILLDIAARIPRGALELELRAQSKLFVRGGRDYRIGPGFDAIARWKRWERLHPFASLFGEWLFGGDVTIEGKRFRAPDDRTLRLLLGAIVPGRAGDIQVFTSLSVGDGKGLQVLKNEFLWGGGVRLALF